RVSVRACSFFLFVTGWQRRSSREASTPHSLLPFASVDFKLVKLIHRISQRFAAGSAILEVEKRGHDRCHRRNKNVQELVQRRFRRDSNPKRETLRTMVLVETEVQRDAYRSNPYQHRQRVLNHNDHKTSAPRSSNECAGTF